MTDSGPVAAVAVGAGLIAAGALRYRFRERLHAFWRKTTGGRQSDRTNWRQQLNYVGGSIFLCAAGCMCLVAGLIRLSR